MFNNEYVFLGDFKYLRREDEIVRWGGGRLLSPLVYIIKLDFSLVKYYQKENDLSQFLDLSRIKFLFTIYVHVMYNVHYALKGKQKALKS